MIKNVCVLGLLIGIVLFAGVIQAADTIGLMRIEAKLSNSSTGLISGTKRVLVKLINPLNPSQPLWSEMHDSVVFSSGVVGLNLGAITPFTRKLFDQHSLNFVFKVFNTDGTSEDVGFPEIIAAYPYAIKSKYVEEVVSDNFKAGFDIGDIPGLVRASQIATGSITDSMIGGTISASKISGAIPASFIIDGSITGAKIATGSIDDHHLTGKITFAKLEISTENLQAMGFLNIKASSNVYIKPGQSVSLLVNDAGYVTSSNIGTFLPGSVLKNGDNISALNNNVGYLTSIPNSVVTKNSNVNFNSLTVNGVSVLTNADVSNAVTKNSDASLKTLKLNNVDLATTLADKVSSSELDANTTAFNSSLLSKAGTVTLNNYVKKTDSIAFSKLVITAENIKSLGISGVDTNTTYNAGVGLKLTGTNFAIDQSVVASKNYVDTVVAAVVATGVSDGAVTLSKLATETITSLNAKASKTALTTETSRATSAEGILTTNLTNEIARATAAENLKEVLANKSVDFSVSNDTLYPSVKATKTYVDAQDATLTTAIGTLTTTVGTKADTAALAAFATTSFVNTTLNSYVKNTRTVNGQPLSANVVLTKSDVGLANVDNTSDLSKPLSTATITTLNTYVKTTVLNTALGLKADTSFVITTLNAYAKTAYVDTVVAAVVATGVSDGAVTLSKLATETITSLNAKATKTYVDAQ
ncbi:MAG: hypothetical protein EXS67_05910, partial [Candidatus Margulisbacteria bacterium]|nr:hypothetical protein [Candidatus Margulisiibacteriota bacterium]